MKNMKEETLEEAAQYYSYNWEKITGLVWEDCVPSQVNKLDFIAGANWQAERMYSEEEMIKFGWLCREKSLTNVGLIFEQFKKLKP